jgi:hypothetical protein
MSMPTTPTSGSGPKKRDNITIDNEGGLTAPTIPTELNPVGYTPTQLTYVNAPQNDNAPITPIQQYQSIMNSLPIYTQDNDYLGDTIASAQNSWYANNQADLAAAFLRHGITPFNSYGAEYDAAIKEHEEWIKNNPRPS